MSPSPAAQGSLLTSRTHREKGESLVLERAPEEGKGLGRDQTETTERGHRAAAAGAGGGCAPTRLRAIFSSSAAELRCELQPVAEPWPPQPSGSRVVPYKTRAPAGSSSSAFHGPGRAGVTGATGTAAAGGALPGFSLPGSGPSHLLYLEPGRKRGRSQ